MFTKLLASEDLFNLESCLLIEDADNLGHQLGCGFFTQQSAFVSSSSLFSSQSSDPSDPKGPSGKSNPPGKLDPLGGSNF